MVGELNSCEQHRTLTELLDTTQLRTQNQNPCDLRKKITRRYQFENRAVRGYLSPSRRGHAGRSSANGSARM
jgi:hypothetical protein